MFCPYCKRQIKDTEVFCPYCQKAIPRQNSPTVKFQQAPSQTVEIPASKPRPKLSTNAKKVIITAALIVVLVLIVSTIFYPQLFPWN